MNKDFPISELRIIKVWYRDNHMPSVYMMHCTQVETFISAQVNLHHIKGNPHLPADRRHLNNLWEIRQTSLDLQTVSYWWCVPNSLMNNDPEGAQLNQECLPEKRMWSHTDLVYKERKERQEAEREEMEADL